MFIGRKDELRQLGSVFATDHSNLLVLYGREGIGKTSLALTFATGKRFLYFRVNDSSEVDQLRFIEKLERAITDEAMKDDKKNKLIVIIDEISYISVPNIDKLIKDTLNGTKIDCPVMFLLLSSSINWVENRMVAEHKDISRFITGIIKLRGMRFAEMVEWFPRISAEDCITIRALFGGVPKYLTLWQDNRRVRENVLSLFFSPDSPLKNEAEFQLKLELRELGVYNTILSCLAAGNYKLNDIYNYTGFSRAKISVYLKNLIEMDIVEKTYSVTVKNLENTKKGLYRIKDNFISFYYAFVFPNLSEIECGKGKTVYNDIVATRLEEYMRYYYADVCREYLELMSKFKKLGAKYTDWSGWYGKKGTIDIIGKDNERHMIAGYCNFSANLLEPEILDEFNELIADSGIKPTKLALFSRTGFSAELLKICKTEGIMTVSINDL